MTNSLELFSGTGGLALGLQQSGFHHRALLEWDKDSCDNIKANIANGFPLIQDWNVVQTDVRLVHYDDFDVQFVAGGPPCQPFSLGGKHQAYNDKRDMFPEAVRAVREIQPRAFVFENVKGLLRESFRTYFNYILLQLTYPDMVKKEGMTWIEHLKLLEQYHTSGHTRGLSYHVVFRLLNAADYGVPQLRQRVIIVGFRSDLDARWSFPEGECSKEALDYAKYVDHSYWEEHRVAKSNRPTITQAKQENIRRKVDAFQKTKPPTRWKTVRDAFVGLEDPRKGKIDPAVSNHIFHGGARPYVGHSGSLLDEPSKTIKAGAHGVPGGENMVILEDGSLRYYTVRESARIQTFPDNYLFYGSWTESMRQIGNAVPVKLAGAIGHSIITQLERMDHNGTEKRHSHIRSL
ncbi:MAG: DNA cytosine methyltransferase [Evtepia sp.]